MVLNIADTREVLIGGDDFHTVINTDSFRQQFGVLRLVVSRVIETNGVSPHWPPRSDFGGDIARVDPAREEAPNLDVADLVRDDRFRNRFGDSVHEILQRVPRLEGEARSEVAAEHEFSIPVLEGVSRRELADVFEECIDAGYAVPRQVVGEMLLI